MVNAILFYFGNSLSFYFIWIWIIFIPFAYGLGQDLFWSLNIPHLIFLSLSYKIHIFLFIDPNLVIPICKILFDIYLSF